MVTNSLLQKKQYNLVVNGCGNRDISLDLYEEVDENRKIMNFQPTQR